MEWSDEESHHPRHPECSKGSLFYESDYVVSVNSERNPTPFVPKGAGFGGRSGAKSLIRSACERVFATRKPVTSKPVTSS